MKGMLREEGAVSVAGSSLVRPRLEPATLFRAIGRQRRMVAELIVVAELLEQESAARRALGKKERDRIYASRRADYEYIHLGRAPDFQRPML
jgi:hypothetical protein